MTQQQVKLPPGAIQFKQFVDYIKDHETLPPDLSVNGNFGAYHEITENLIDTYNLNGFDGFTKALNAIIQAKDNKGKPHFRDVYLALVAAVEQEEDQHFEFLEFGDLKTLPPPEWMVYRFLPTKGVNFIYGPAGEGKTYLLTGLNVAVATDGMNWQELATKHGHCIYIAAEDIDEVAQRFIGTANHYGLADIPKLHIFPASLQLVKDTPKLIESIKHKYGNIDIAMITVDTLSMCSLGIEENSKKEFDAVTASLEMLWRTYNCCVVAVHHTGRNGEIRGTSSMDGVGYSMIKVKKDDESLLVHSDKMRRGKKFEDFYLDWLSVDVPGVFDEMGEQVTTGLLIKSSRTAGADPSKLTKLQQEILDHAQNFGGVDVPRTDLIKACQIARSNESSFVNAASGLIGKGLLKMSKEKQRVSYTLTELAIVALKTTTNNTCNNRQSED